MHGAERRENYLRRKELVKHEAVGLDVLVRYLMFQLSYCWQCLFVSESDQVSCPPLHAFVWIK